MYLDEVNIYWVLAWNTHYPYSGLGNVHSTHKTMEEAETEESELKIRDSHLNTEIIDISSYL